MWKRERETYSSASLDFRIGLCDFLLHLNDLPFGRNKRFGSIGKSEGPSLTKPIVKLHFTPSCGPMFSRSRAATADNQNAPRWPH